MKKLLLSLLLLAFVGTAIFITVSRKPDPVIPSNPNTVTVVTSNMTIAAFAKDVAGDSATVTSLAKPGIEVHDFEPTPKQIASLSDADLFIINGAGLEPWAEKIIPDLQKNGVTVVRLSDSVTLRKADKTSDEHGHDETETSDSHGHDEAEMSDPHFWLSPVVMQKGITAIAEGLRSVEPTNADQYTKNAATVNTELANLDAEYRKNLAPERCQLDTIIAAHDAYGYLAAEYGFTIEAISGISPEEEPSAARLSELAELVKKTGIKHIFFESLTSPKLAETIAKETGATTLELNPLEGFSEEDIANKKTYISIAKDNLANLKTAMQCQ
mgnify:CR=1 FL=1